MKHYATRSGALRSRNMCYDSKQNAKQESEDIIYPDGNEEHLRGHGRELQNSRHCFFNDPTVKLG